MKSRGCLACHSIGDEDNKLGGTFAANLQKVGEKANFDYIVRWIHNPRERWAPYCPKEKRDLTEEDYKKHNLPYVFDTEIHSRCPNDGAELQVQNMTVMPNFRLSETDARDIATLSLLAVVAAPVRGRFVHGQPGAERKGHIRSLSNTAVPAATKSKGLRTNSASAKS